MDYPFRVQSPDTVQRRVAAIVAQGAGGPAPAPPQAGADVVQQYLARIIKLIPAEIVALYQGVRGIVATAASAGDPDAASWLGLLPWCGAALVIFVRMWGTRDGTGSWRTVQWGAVAIATISFVIWVISLGNPIALLPLNKPWVGSVLLMVWPFFVPYFYKGD
jgi:hypothetical protein